MVRIFCVTGISLVLFLLSPGLAAQSRTEPVLTAQDSRDGSALRQLLSSGDPAVRAEALLAAGSLQDTALTGVIISLLGDPETPVRRNAAFALGQLNYQISDAQRLAIAEPLFGLLNTEQDELVIVRTVEALGKSGHQESLNRLVAFAEGRESRDIVRECVLSIGRYGYRGIRSSEGTRFAAGLLDHHAVPVQEAAAYALRRIEQSGLLEPYANRLREAVAGGNDAVKREVAVAMAALRDRESYDVLMVAALSENDWKVRVNAIRSLARYPFEEETVDVLMDLATDANEHVGLTALGTMQTLSPDPLAISATAESLLWLIEDSGQDFSQRRKDAAALALIQIRKDDGPDNLLAWEGKEVTVRTIIAGLGIVGGEDAYARLKDYAHSGDPIERRLALESMLRVVSSGKDDRPSPAEVRSVFIEALSDTDFSVITTAASSLGDSLLRDSSSLGPVLDRLKELQSSGFAEAMAEMIRTAGLIGSVDAVPVLETLLHDEDPTVASAAAEALTSITGVLHGASSGGRTPYADYDWELLRWIREYPQVIVETDEGTFTFEMLPDEAPFTSLSFTRLIRRGFFDGLSFHRVVPNFVIQGGDPHGDGWGGPGYSIRSEFGLQHYERGTVGVASSGKDTEGCQFFVTHSPQPHLDGRYTIFGRVTGGQDAVDAIQVGNMIIRMRLAGDAR